MKKINLLLLALMFCAAIACKKEEPKKVIEEPKPKKETIKVTKEAKKATKGVTIGAIHVPSFENDKVNSFAVQYAQYVEDYKTAYKEMQGGDHQVFNDLAKKGKRMEDMAEKFIGNLKGKEGEKMTKFIKEVKDEISKVVQGK